jgi:alkyl hydroperoxide reductase subunit AhpC
MSVTVGQDAPSFTVRALEGREFTEISLADYAGRWVVLFFYAMDFTQICPTELLAFEARHEEFVSRDAALLGGSTDTEYCHRGWVDSELGELSYPLFADVTRRMALDYGVLVPERGLALRGTFIIDPAGTVRWVTVHDLAVGRSVDETLRVLDALQSGEPRPCDWRPRTGDEIEEGGEG